MSNTPFAWSGPRQKADEPSRVDLAREKAAAEAAIWRHVCKAVDQRDGRQCRCCDKRSDPDATGLLRRGHRHHIIPRSAMGPSESWNLVTLDALCHDAVHVKRTLRIEGAIGERANADEALIFWRLTDGEWHIEREEIAVRIIRHD